MKPEPPPIEWIDGAPHFRGLKVETRTVDLAGTVYRVLALRDAADLLDEPDYAKQFVENDLAPYGMELWPAATMLAAHVLAHDPGEDREAIELGAGLGLVGMAATRAGWRIRVTDHEPTSLRFAAHNAALNKIDVHAFAVLDWNDPPTDRRYARILAADVLYQLVDHTPFLRCVDTLLQHDGAALVADPNRGVVDRFAQLAGKLGFTVDTIETEATNQSGDSVRGRIFRLTRT